MKTITLIIIYVVLIASCKKDSPTGNNNNKFNTPTNLSAVFFTNTLLILQWKDNSNIETRFEIEQSVDSVNFVLVRTIGKDTTTALVSGTYSSDTPYYFRVCAISGTRRTGYSNVIKEKAALPSTPVVKILSPTNNASITDTVTIAVDATDNLGIVRLEIYIDNELDSSRVFVTPPYKWYWNVSSLPDGGTHSIYAKAYDGDENSSSSEVFTVTTHYSDMAPSNLQVTMLDDTSAILQWVDNSNFETRFEIEQSINNTNDFTFLDTVSANTTLATILLTYTGDTTTYYFRVRGKSGLNSTSYSNISSGTTYSLFDMVFVTGGPFLMGSPDGYGNPDEHPQHIVTVSSFSISKYEVTQTVWKKVVLWKQMHGGTTLIESPSNFSGDSTLPVEKVSWDEVTLWINYLNEMYNTNTFSLPTEAEWEYAARGGNQWNENLTYSGSNTADSVAWFSSNSGSQTHRVGIKQVNQLGINDMSGNVMEWCNDWYDGNYYSQSQNSTNPQGPTNGSYHVTRGGSWSTIFINCRVGYRRAYNATDRSSNLGFRVVRAN
ncbi:MAG: SUMF1/EgtB/PvdO family nonheme iron enzyme [Ignavibacteriales bacterium]|nr:SUMF1/EgtB/PvdO family nonheme iron enzyme [Ignavibacteriales bacterium]